MDDEPRESAGDRDAAGRWSSRRPPLLAVVIVWGGLQLVWLRAFRWTRYAEIDEAAYMGMAARLAGGSWTDRWFVLSHEGVHGPLQAMLAAPLMEATVVDMRVLIAVNIVLVGVTALATGSLVRRLAGPGAGMLAGIVVLCAVGVVEMGRTAMTAVLPMCGAALALVALERSEGLRRLGWCAAAGCALGAMTLGRSMAIGFLPMAAAAGLTWASSRRTPWRRALLGGAVVAAAAMAVAGWWWLIRWDAVTDYLFGGGSYDTIQSTDRLAKARVHLRDLRRDVGPALIATLVAVPIALLAGARDARPSPPRARPTGVVEWALVAALVVGLVTLVSSSAPGIGFTLPLVPATVAVTVVALRRATSTSASWWRASAAVVIVVAVAGAVVLPGSGLSLPSVWGCATADERIKVQCSIRSNEDGEAWRAVSDRIADRIVAITSEVATEPPAAGRPPVAMTPRDVGVNPNTVGLSLQLRHHQGSELWSYFTPGVDHEEQIEAVIGSARAIVIVDEPPGDAILGTYAPPTDLVLAAARDAGFLPCETVPLPDGRRARIVVDTDVPPEVCATGSR